MIELFKKKAEPQGSNPLPDGNPNIPMETGKEIQFKDEKTGEFVYRRTFNADQKKMLWQAFQENTAAVNGYLQASLQMMDWTDRAKEARKNMQTQEKKINESVDKIRDELKLDKRWGINPNLMVLERRDPPLG